MALLEKSFIRTQSNRAARINARPRIAVAVPANNEVERIIACVDALNAQMGEHGRITGSLRLIVLTNQCTDGTYERTLACLERWQIGVTLLDVLLPRPLRNAGCARWLVNHAAVDVLPPDGGLLFMSDADSTVPEDWIFSYARLLRSGYDAVAGLVSVESSEAVELPEHLRKRTELEEHYTYCLDRLESLRDPVEHDPWPRHYTASGANLAMRADCLRMIEDFPRVACGEDKALVRRLEGNGCRVRHDTVTRVITSARLFGRAAGGMADTLRYRSRVPSALCDERIESVNRADFRASLRAALRRLYQMGSPRLCALLGVFQEFGVKAPSWICDCLDLPFPKAWQTIEDRHPDLQRIQLSPDRLSFEIAQTRKLIDLNHNVEFDPTLEEVA